MMARGHEGGILIFRGAKDSSWNSDLQETRRSRRAVLFAFIVAFIGCIALLGSFDTVVGVTPLTLSPDASLVAPSTHAQVRNNTSKMVLERIVPLFFPMETLVDAETQTFSPQGLAKLAETIDRLGHPVSGKIGWSGQYWIDDRDETSCRVHVLIRHFLHIGDVERLQSAVASRNASWNHVFKYDMGPDALRIALIGDKEITMGMSRRLHLLTYEGTALNGSSSSPSTIVYLSTIRAYWQGTYRIVVKHDYDDFWAMNDEHDTAYRDQQGKDLLEHKEITCMMPQAVLKSPGDFLPPARPYCTGTSFSAEYGRYLSASSLQLGSMKQRGRQEATYLPLIRGSEYMYEFVGCKHFHYHLSPGLLADDAATYHKEPQSGLRILFSGDSQIRTLFWHWLGVLDNKIPNTHKTFNESVRSARGGQVDFVWDAYLNGTLTRGTSYIASQRYDVIVLGIGSWPASYGQWSAERFEQQMELVRSFVDQLAMEKSGITVVYAGSPAWPKHRKNSPGFRITNYRLGLYNTIARRILHPSHNMRFLPFFELSYPLPKLKSKDSMHYDHSIILYSAVDTLATFILRSRQ